MEKLLSLIIPSYNMEKFLPRCLDSLILEESLDKMEVLIINDGSEDRTSEIAHEYQDKYPNTFVAIDKENGNYGSCVNKGIEIATGTYIRLLDADDYVDTKALSIFLSKLINLKHQVDMVVTNFRKVSLSGEIINEIRPKKNIEFGKVFNFEEIDLCDIVGGYTEMHRSTYRTKLLQQIGLKLDTGISYTDLEFQFFPLEKIQSIVFFDLYLYHYVLGREGQTASLTMGLKHFDNYLKVRDRIFPIYRQHEGHAMSCRNAERAVVVSLSFSIFTLVFHNFKKSIDCEKELKKTFDYIKSDPLAIQMLKDKFGNMPIFLLWQKFGIYWGEYQFLERFYKIMYNLKKVLYR